MFINNLRIHNFRNIKQQEFSFTNKVNIFYGENGAGKTSILEAIHYLSGGKSFRKGNYKSLINFNEDALAVYIEGSNNVFSVSKNRQGQWKAKHNNSSILKQSTITKLFPVVSIDPEVYRLVDFGPIYRRNFLDWLVFHVKHDYLVLWKKVYKCIKQLNILYKKKASNKEITLWEENLIVFSEELNKVRKRLFDEILPIIKRRSHSMQEEIKELSITYNQGWLDDLTIADQIKKDRLRNLQYGKLQHGPHKMDIIIKTKSLPAAQTLSRGQKKILSISFYMAYIDLLLNKKISPVLCLDDLDAEIDDDKLSKASEFFNKTGVQIFVTSVQPEKISKVFPQAQMFHVKH